MVAIDLAAGPVWLVVEPGSHGVDISRLDPAAWRFTADLFAGYPIGAMLAAEPPTNAAELLAEHLLAGGFLGSSYSVQPYRSAIRDRPKGHGRLVRWPRRRN